ncbi:hypothetical protein MUG78_17850 [Gordonia alkaliphila]|uniref:hypothetical protein n=1 Tax=Gordonia alkaliphila TaxID=1053547 RepID=UPI001FF63343|nr:hypothetical protein [Gordonia alkaliphila]MCK0441266.1 hypothetical protein [Gordonia alkaliphila]
MDEIQTGDMWLVYVDSEGGHHYQPWTEVVQSGSLVDPTTDQDMEIVGWAIGATEDPR